MSRTDLDATTLASGLRMRAGDGSMEWVYEPIQASVLLDIADMLDENAKLRELIGDLREYIAGNADACDFCPQLGTCENHPAPPPCKYELTSRDHAVLDFIADCLSELGIEVDG